MGISLASVAYLLWASLGKVLTGHAGLFFIDPELMGDLKGAAVAASLIFVLLSSGGEWAAIMPLAYRLQTNTAASFCVHVRIDRHA